MNKESINTDENNENEFFIKVEKVIFEVISFGGKYLITLINLIFCPAEIIQELKNSNIRISSNKNAKPLTFLIISFFIFLFVFSKGILLIDAHFKQESACYLNEIINIIKSFNYTNFEALLLLVPLVLISALIAKSSSLIINKLGVKTSYQLQLNIISYFLGAFCMNIAIIFAISIIFYKKIITPSPNIFVILILVLIILIIPILILRFIQIQKRTIGLSTCKAIFIEFIVITYFLAVVFLFLLFPFQ